MPPQVSKHISWHFLQEPVAHLGLTSLQEKNYRGHVERQEIIESHIKCVLESRREY